MFFALFFRTEVHFGLKILLRDCEEFYIIYLIDIISSFLL